MYRYCVCGPVDYLLGWIFYDQLVGSCWITCALDGSRVNHAIWVIVEQLGVVVWGEIDDPHHVRIHCLIWIHNGKYNFLFQAFCIEERIYCYVWDYSVWKLWKWSINCICQGIAFVKLPLVNYRECPIFKTYRSHYPIYL